MKREWENLSLGLESWPGGEQLGNMRGRRRYICNRRSEIINGLSPGIKCVALLFRDIAKVWYWGGGARPQRPPLQLRHWSWQPWWPRPQLSALSHAITDGEGREEILIQFLFYTAHLYNRHILSSFPSLTHKQNRKLSRQSRSYASELELLCNYWNFKLQ